MLTLAQMTTLRDLLLAAPEMSTALDTADDLAMTAWLNTPDPSNAVCWQTQYSLDELLDTLNFTTFISRSVAEREALNFMFSKDVVNPSRPNVRQGINDIFSGTAAAAVLQRTAVLTAMQRTMTRAEKALALPPVDGAAVLTFEGELSYSEVSQFARR